MLAQAFFFWVFAAVLVLSALAVILARNPVHSVLFLILAFVAASAQFVLLGAEFLAMMLIVVYVGAVAVLFLFVVMLLDVDFAQLKQGFVQYLPIGGLIYPKARIEELFRIFETDQVGVVVDSGTIVGIVSKIDVLEHLTRARR